MDIQNRIAKAMLAKATKLDTNLLKTQGKDISVKQNIAALPEPSKITLPQIERTQAIATGETAQVTLTTKQDYMTALTPKKRTVNYERFIR
jgi:hypothetical protein